MEAVALRGLCQVCVIATEIPNTFLESSDIVLSLVPDQNRYLKVDQISPTLFYNLQLTIFCPWLFILLFSSNKQDTSEKLDTIFYKHENTRRLEEVIFFVTLCSSQARKKNQKCFCIHFIILHRRTFLECHSFWQNEEEIAIYPSCSFALFLKSILILIDAVTSTKKWGELIFLLHLLIQFSRQQKESTWLLICWFLVLHPYSIS